MPCAVSGAATDLLARPDAKRLVVIGAGAQGVTQAAAVAAVRPIETITVVDVFEASLERFRDAIGKDWPELSDRIETTTDASVVREADVICTSTTSRNPVFKDSDVRPGTHINGIGSFTPEMQELPPELVARATIVVDQAMTWSPENSVLSSGRAKARWLAVWPGVASASSVQPGPETASPSAMTRSGA